MPLLHPTPEPVVHVFEVDLLYGRFEGLHHKEMGEYSHNYDPAPEEHEHSVLHAAEHGQESLGHHEGEQKVDARVQTHTGGSSLQGKDFSRD